MAKLTEKGIIDIYRGDTSDLVLDWFEKNLDGGKTPIDLTLYDRIDFQVRPQPDAKGLYAHRTTTDNTITIHNQNTLIITLPHEVTKEFPRSRKGHYADIQFIKDGVITSFPGDDKYWRLPVTPDITQV